MVPGGTDSTPIYRSNHRVLCAIAGLDPTGGAGIAADLRAFAAHGGWGTAVVTALTLQDERGVQALRPVEAATVAAQVGTALRTQPAALKVGMLATLEVLEAVAGALDDAGAPPLVLDPVLAASAGGLLLEERALPALAARLAPHTTLLTPNLPEAARLLGLGAIPEGGPLEAARALRALGWQAVLLKGGHGAGETCVDHLVEAGGEHAFSRARVPGPPLRGTGCTLSAAIAARLGAGEPLAAAVRGAGDWLHDLIVQASASGSGRLLPLPPAARGQ